MAGMPSYTALRRDPLKKDDGYTPIGEYVSEFMNEKMKRSRVNMHVAWESIAGKEIASVTEFAKIIRNTLYVYASSPAAATLVALSKRRLIKSFNESLAMYEIKEIQVIKRY